MTPETCQSPDSISSKQGSNGDQAVNVAELSAWLHEEAHRAATFATRYQAASRFRAHWMDRSRTLSEAASALTASASEPAPSFQARVQPWMMACFGEEISNDRVERGDRLLEEVFELLQSGGYDPARVLSLRDYVWSREVGEPSQEAGGVQVTMAAYCLAHGLDMHEAGETELARIWTKVETIRAKQAAKPKHSPLPVPASEPEPVAWRWKPKNATLWIYDPEPEWLAAQDPSTIDKEPLYAEPVPTPDRAVEALHRAKLTLERYQRAGLGDEVFHADLTDALRVVDAALETPWQKPGRAAQAQAGEKPDFPADEQSGETSHGAVTDALERYRAQEPFGGDMVPNPQVTRVRFDDAMAKIAALSHPADGWRDIASVPTPVDHARTTGICKDDDKLTWWQDGNPTHWMPLPAAPLAAKPEGE